MVVPVLITSCQVFEKWNIGPLMAQPSTSNTATTNPYGEPVARLVPWAIFRKRSLILIQPGILCATLVALAAARTELHEANQDDEARPCDADDISGKVPEISQKETQAEEHDKDRNDFVVDAAACRCGIHVIHVLKLVAMH